MINPFSLIGKNIIISGASSGIGRQTAITCSKLGARVVLLARDEKRLEETVSMMDNSSEHLFYSIDLTDYDSVKNLIKQVVGIIGRIDGVVNCAGISLTIPLNLVTPSKIRKVFETNVFASYNLTKEICNFKNISKNGASVVFISSVMACYGEVGKSLYSMSKGAIISAVKSLACELAPKNIRVNAISPGAIITPINESLPHMVNKELREKLEQKHLLGLGETVDIANSCVYLLSEASKWVTGTNLTVDGGYSAQ